MFYIIGEYGMNYFVWDTSDDSCELVSKVDLNKSGLYAEKIADSLNFSKVRMLHGLKTKDDKNYISNPIFLYTLPHKVFNSDDIEVGMQFGVLVCKFEDLFFDKDKDFVLLMRRKYGYSDDFVAIAYMLETRNYTHYHGLISGNAPYSPMDFSKSPVITRIDIIHRRAIGDVVHKVRGMIIPMRMLDYTLKLAKQRDAEIIFSAYNGVFDKRTIVDGDRSMVKGRDGKMVKVPRCAGNIKFLK